MKTKASILVVALLFTTLGFVKAQYSPNVITTAVPFLANSHDARGTSMGDCGVATDVDAFSLFYNPAKYAFMKNEHTMISSGFSLWSGFTHPISLYSTFAQKIGNSAVAAGIRFFGANEIEYWDQYNQPMGVYSPREFAVDAAYSYRFGDYLSAGIAGRFIYSNLLWGGSDSSHPGISFACDLGVYYNRPVGGIVDLSLGASIINIGTKMSYSATSTRKGFVPTTMLLGSGVKFNFGHDNSLAVNFQLSKLLVPTPPIYYNDTMYGMNNDVSVLRGMFQSFYDAPGYSINLNTNELNHIGTFYEELCEINVGVGVEYSLFNHGFFRTGFFYEPALKGGRKYLALGAGMRFGIFGMDVSYNIPIGVVYGYNNIYHQVIQWDMYFAF